MKESVDKEKEEVFGVCVSVLRSFFTRNGRTKNDLAARFADLV